MKPVPHNLAASIRARLLNIAKQSKRDFNAILLQYFQERFLYRLSISPHKNNLILKGALLFLAYKAPAMRPTKDIDFLGLAASADPEHLTSIIQKIASISVEDGVEFLTDTITTEIIREERKYQGIRLKLDAKLTTAKKTLQLDVGFGDVVIPQPVEMQFPTLLDQPAPFIRAYSKESVVAEKFEAIVYLNFLTSRMKDFYDILFLAQNYSFQLDVLGKAIQTTFHQRNTSLDDRGVIFTDEFRNHSEKQVQWNAFLSRNNLETIADFSKVIAQLKGFIDPACSKESIANNVAHWNPPEWRWEG